MDRTSHYLHNTHMDYFHDLKFYRFNHLKNHQEHINTCFQTYAINYLASGHIYWQINDDSPLILKSPCVYWTVPGPRYIYHRAGDADWEHYFISFTGSRPKRWASAGLIFTECNSIPYLAVTQPDRVRHVFNELIALLSKAPIWNPEAVLKLETLLLHLHQQPSPEWSDHPRRPELIELIREIDEAPHLPFDFNQIAKGLHMTPAHLRRLFKQHTGHSPVQYLNHIRLNHAATLLRTSPMPVKQVANESGYDDIYYFTRHFSRQFKLPPAKYRKAFQSNE